MLREAYVIRCTRYCVACHTSALAGQSLPLPNQIFTDSNPTQGLQCRSADRAGNPIVAEERFDDDAINYPELQARIEIAHRTLIKVDDAAGRQWPHVVYLDDDLFAYSFNKGIFRPRAILDATKFLTQARLDGSRPDRGIIALAGGCVPAALPPSGPERIVCGCCANDRIPSSGSDNGA